MRPSHPVRQRWAGAEPPLFFKLSPFFAVYATVRNGYPRHVLRSRVLAAVKYVRMLPMATWILIDTQLGRW